MIRGVAGSGGGGLTPGTTVITGGAAYAILREDGSQVLAASSSLTFGGAAAGTGLFAAAGTATTAVSPLSITQTVNAAGIVFPGIVYNVTKTAAATGSLFADYQISGTSAVSIGFPGTNGTLGTITFPGIKLVSGVDTLTLSADNNFTATVASATTLFLKYGGTGYGIGVLGSGTPGSESTLTQASANGLTLSRFGLLIGRHGANTTTTWAGIRTDTNTADDVVGATMLKAQSAYSEATSNVAGGNIIVAGGIGRRFVTIADYTVLGGKTVTVVINGTSTTKTEGVNWTAATSNAATATSLAAAFNGVTGLDTNFTIAVGAVAYFQPTANTYSLTLSTNSGSAVATSGADGFIQAGTTVTSASVAAAFSATHYIPIKDGSGTTYYMPVDSAAW